MLRPRLIPSLLLHDGGLVKTRGFANPRYVGDPVNAVRIFSEKGADEILISDIDVSLQGRNPDFDLIRKLAGECRMPMTYVGGVRTVADVERIVACGVEKVGLCTTFSLRPEIVSECAAVVGTQSVAVVLDVRRSKSGYEVFIQNGQKTIGNTPIASALLAESLGAGEIILNSIDRDGFRQGYDIGLAKSIRSSVSVPITLLGGAGSLEDVSELYQSVSNIGAAAGSLFVFQGRFDAVLLTYPDWDRREALHQRTSE